MRLKNNETIVYSLNIEDIQTVALKEKGRELTTEEIESILEPIAEKIDWYNAISEAIFENLDVKT